MATVNECLILAAGNGSRIASVSGGSPKPLVPLRRATSRAHSARVMKPEFRSL